jgi:aspartyl-tRNA(Asn)/glutamyl-tRNA(Gln) amidotransferase subunit A
MISAVGASVGPMSLGASFCIFGHYGTMFSILAVVPIVVTVITQLVKEPDTLVVSGSDLTPNRLMEDDVMANRTESQEATQACLDAIATHDDTVHAMITVTAEAALRQAEAADKASAQGRWLGLLHGMPMAIKDNIATAGVRTTAGSVFFTDHVPNENAPVVDRLMKAGAVMVGKATMHEFAFGIRSDNTVSPPCRNPWNLERVPGGSSGGSGAAVASNMCVGALGSDTGGSVRLPASINGISGLRPTHGRVPSHGSTPVSPSFDTIGPMARSVADVARIFAVIAGYDARDPHAVDRPLENFLPRLNDGIEGVRIGLPRNFYLENLNPEIEIAVQQAVRVLEGLGAKLVEIDVPGAAEMQHWATIMIFADACAFHAERLKTHPEKFSKPVYDRMTTGHSFTAVDYANALRAREAWKNDLARIFGEIDILLSPTLPTLVPPIAEDKSLLEATRDATRNTYAGAFGQLPGLSVPCGFSSDGLPIGLQLEAAWWNDPLLLRAGHAYQGRTDWHLRRPPLG